MRRALPLLALLAAAGCASTQPAAIGAPGLDAATESRVAPRTIGSAEDAAAVADGLAGLVAARLPPGGAAGPLQVRPAPEDALLAPALEAALRRAGYALAPDGRHVVGYAVGPLGNAVVAQVAVDGRFRAARAFARAGGKHGGALQPAGNGGVMLPEGAAW